MKTLMYILSFLLCLTACSSGKEENFVLNFTNEILLPHTPVRNQGRTQTCWAYSMASMLESNRLLKSGDTVRLSVMYAVRQKYMKQFELYYYSKGGEEIRGGGLGHSFLWALKEKGAMPDEVYKGCLAGATYHDHRALLKQLKALAEEAVDKKDIHTYREKAEGLLDKHMGVVPKTFVYKGIEYTSFSFADSLEYKADDYVELTSFTHHPFYDCFVLEVPDNWEHILYYNVPIDSMEMYVCKALRHGQTVAWDGDTSEKGFLARLGMAIYPDSLVSQQDRQEAYEQFETTDDHMMHIIGTAYDEEGKFYYILKNSWGKIGPYKGLIYMSKEYFRAKTISVVLPKRCFD